MLFTRTDSNSNSSSNNNNSFSKNSSHNNYSLNNNSNNNNNNSASSGINDDDDDDSSKSELQATCIPCTVPSRSAISDMYSTNGLSLSNICLNSLLSERMYVQFWYTGRNGWFVTWA